jgi:hypothetical protein
MSYTKRDSNAIGLSVDDSDFVGYIISMTILRCVREETGGIIRSGVAVKSRDKRGRRGWQRCDWF